MTTALATGVAPWAARPHGLYCVPVSANLAPYPDEIDSAKTRAPPSPLFLSVAALP